MKIAFVIFNGMVTLDFLGVYDTVTRLKGMGFMDNLEWDICALTDRVTDATGSLHITPTKTRPNLGDYDIVVIPGGRVTPEILEDPDFMGWIGTAESCRTKVSVCTGSLIMGAAGFLKGKRATTHWRRMELLEPYTTVVQDQRIVDEGDVLTAGGITSSIDMGLYLCGKLAGREAMEAVKRQIEYPYGIEHADFGAPIPVG